MNLQVSSSSGEIKVIVCTFFYDAPRTEMSLRDIREAFSEIVPFEVNPEHPLTMCNETRTVCLSVQTDFLEVRSSEGKGIEEKKGLFVKAVSKVIDDPIIRIAGTTLRLVALAKFDRSVNLVSKLADSFLSKAPFVEKTLQTNLEGLSTKFYFKRDGYETELDIGNYRFDNTCLYIELEIRKEDGFTTAADFNKLWTAMEISFQRSFNLANQLIEAD